jgi:hypothetical protein
MKKKKNPAAVALGRKGGTARGKLSKEKLSAIGKHGAAVRWTVTGDVPGKFVIEVSHRKSGSKKYMGAKPAPAGDTERDFVNTMFDRWEDASRYPYPSEQVAAAMVVGFPDTQNLDYAVVAAKKGGKS